MSQSERGLFRRRTPRQVLGRSLPTQFSCPITLLSLLNSVLFFSSLLTSLSVFSSSSACNFNAQSLSLSFLIITDRIFREDCKTVQVYEARTKEIVAAAVRGFNGKLNNSCHGFS